MKKESPSERLDLQRAVDEAEREFAQGIWIESPMVVAKIKGWLAKRPPRPGTG